jgi:hypothetical protein
MRLKIRQSHLQFNAKEEIKMQTVLEQNRIAESIINRTNGAFGSKIGLIGKLFGCWHKKLSRPFTNRNASYRACLNCGARKGFDTRTLQTIGPFYYPPAISFDEN